jgi:hypothetical protein
MKTQEIVVYRIYAIDDDTPRFTTDSFEEAKSYYDEGFFIQELHTMKWEPTPKTKTSTTVMIEW